jgi:hypothetical protein
MTKRFRVRRVDDEVTEIEGQLWEWTPSSDGDDGPELLASGGHGIYTGATADFLRQAGAELTELADVVAKHEAKGAAKSLRLNGEASARRKLFDQLRHVPDECEETVNALSLDKLIADLEKIRGDYPGEAWVAMQVAPRANPHSIEHLIVGTNRETGEHRILLSELSPSELGVSS